MRRILFVCHGNICRSPMAEYVLKEMVRQAGREDEFLISSAATSTEEIGNDVYPPARRCLVSHAIPCPSRAARQMRPSDYDLFDEIYLMDSNNRRNIRRICPNDEQGKIRMLLPRDVADPWYTGNFEITYNDVVEGCEKILHFSE